jgi:hypothetical protein
MSSFTTAGVNVLLDTVSTMTRLHPCQCYIVFVTHRVHKTVNSELILKLGLFNLHSFVINFTVVK